MAERELKIISEARTTLNDKNLISPRWSNERLSELLSDAQDDMCKLLPMIALKATINTSQGQEEYRLPEESVKLLTANADGRPLVITSHDEIERDFPDWETNVGAAYTNIIVNDLSQQTIRPYPLVQDGVTQTIKVRFQAMPIRLGWVVETEEPILVANTVEELTINDMWDFALKQYVIGMAFLDYGDAASISRSQVALGLYAKEFARAEKLSKKSFAKRARTTGYQAKVASHHTGDSYGRSSSRY